MVPSIPRPLRHLVVVLGDQLDPESSALVDFDPAQDAVWMAEVPAEATHVWSHKARIALFLAAMRHFRDAQRALGRAVRYRELGADPEATLAEALAADVATLRPRRVIAVQPGEWRLAEQLPAAVRAAGSEWAERTDTHFLATPEEFATWAKGRKELRLEFFYRHMRRRERVLMDGDQPVGGRWNFDAENRSGFDARGPGLVPAPRAFPPDATTRAVLDLVAARFGDHPGSLARFDWPVTPAEAEAALEDFIAHRLPLFGRYQDAMWTGEAWLWHSRLSAAMNLKLLHPRRVIDAAVAAHAAGAAPIEAVEGFFRQVLGWREYVRGVYWLRMPRFAQDNALGATAALPGFYWTGDTDMACLRHAIGQTLEYGYAHHIQRLMVTGLFALLYGVRPEDVHRWYLAVYVDAVEWVELPNTLGMSQYADGGHMVSKPYAASGRYIERMSNYCAGCRFRPDEATGPRACPFTTLYWDFLDRHRARFARHPRTALQWKNLERLGEARLAEIRAEAGRLRQRIAGEGRTPPDR
jgi:deoxyribodipyrimidine photolyase-related protein